MGEHEALDALETAPRRPANTDAGFLALEDINMQWCGVTADAGKPLAEFFSRCRSMRRLNFAANPLLKNALDYFGEPALPQLRYLDVTMCGIVDITPISDLTVLSPHVEDVVLRENPIAVVGPINSKEVDVSDCALQGQSGGRVLATLSFGAKILHAEK